MKSFLPTMLMLALNSLFGCSAWAEECSPRDPNRQPPLPRLHVEGNRIIDEEGNEVRLRGVHFEDPFVLDVEDLDLDGYADHRFDEVEADFARVKELGANLVRVAIYPGYYFLLGRSYLELYLDRMVDLARENGLYISLSYHAIGRPGGWYSSSSDNMLYEYPVRLHYSDTGMAVEFWDTVAARYGRESHVLYEIYNEPADDTAEFTWADWRPTGELLIQTVRRHSASLIFGPGMSYTADLSAVPEDPYSDPDVVYVAHIYPGTIPEGTNPVEEWERLFGFLADTYPVIVSEWGFRDGADDPLYDGTVGGYAEPLLDYLDARDVHWVAFLYHPPDSDMPMVESDWTTLTEFGEFVAERLGE